MIPMPKKGYQSRYFFDPLFRRLSINQNLDDENFLKNDKSRPPPSDESEQNSSSDGVDIQVKAEQELDDLVARSLESLLNIQTAIPLNPFPDRIIIDTNKVTIIFKYFFWSEQIHSVFIKDITDVLVETGLLWSTLKIIDVGFTDNSIDIGYLKTGEARKARKIIQGLIVAHKNGIDLSKSDSPDLAEKLEQIGKAERSI